MFVECDTLPVHLRFQFKSLANRRHSGGNGTIDETLYAIQDANWDITALADTSGTVVERFRYDPYGRNLVLEEDFAVDPDGNNDYDWEYRFTSREYDAETSLHYFRARYWHPDLGRFIGRDPLEYIDGASLYAGYFVPGGMDPSGKTLISCQFTTVFGGSETRTVDCPSGKTANECCGSVDPGWKWYLDDWGILNQQPDSPATCEHSYMDLINNPWKMDTDLAIGSYGCTATAAFCAGGAVGVTIGGFATGTGVLSTGTSLGLGGGGVPTLVSRWGRPGLQPGDWVMKGGKNYPNYILSGKYQPGFTNKFAPYSSGQEFTVSSQSLRWPQGPLGPIKGCLGQRRYFPYDSPCIK